MHKSIIIAVALAVVVLSYGLKTRFFRGSSTVAVPAISAVTLSPYEIHLNHPNIAELPVQEIPAP
jgi:hypothetical protein